MKNEIISIPKRKVFAYNMHQLNNNIFNEGNYNKIPYGNRKNLHIRSGSRQEKMINQLVTLNSENLKKENLDEDDEKNIILPNIDLNNGTILYTDFNKYDKNFKNKGSRNKIGKNNTPNKEEDKILKNVERKGTENLDENLKNFRNAETILMFEKDKEIDRENEKYKLVQSSSLNSHNIIRSPSNNIKIDYQFGGKKLKNSDTVSNNINLPPKIPNYHLNKIQNDVVQMNKANTMDSSIKSNFRNHSADDIDRIRKVAGNEHELINKLPEIQSRQQSPENKCGNEVLYFHDNENLNNRLIKTLEIQKNRNELFKNNVLKKNIQKENELTNYIDIEISKRQIKDTFDYKNFWEHKKEVEKIHRDILKFQINEKFKKKEDLNRIKNASRDGLIHEVNKHKNNYFFLVTN